MGKLPGHELPPRITVRKIACRRAEASDRCKAALASAEKSFLWELHRHGSRMSDEGLRSGRKPDVEVCCCRLLSGRLGDGQHYGSVTVDLPSEDT